MSLVLGVYKEPCAGIPHVLFPFCDNVLEFLNKAHENFEVDSEFQEFFFIFIDYLLNQKGLAFYSLDTWILNVS